MVELIDVASSDRKHRLESPSYNPKHAEVYGTSYVMIVMQVMQKIGLRPVEGVMDVESKLMKVTEQIQADLSNIQQYITTIQKLSESGGTYFCAGGHVPAGVATYLCSNGNNGLSNSEFFEGGDGLYGNKTHIASDLKIATVNFIKTFKNLFVGQTCTPDSELRSSNYTQFDVTKVVNGKPTKQSFDLSGIFNRLNSEGDDPSSPTNPPGWGLIKAISGGQTVFNNSDNMSASLIQQYAFYKYKLEAEESSKLIPGAEAGLDFSMDPSNANFDGIGKSLFGLANGFNQTVTTTRQESAGLNMDNGQFSNSSQSILKYIFKSNPFANDLTSAPQYDIGKEYVGILGAFSYAAFNYFWTKNPNQSTEYVDFPGETPAQGSSGRFYNYYGGDKGLGKGLTGDGDKLSTWFSNSQSAGSVISNNTNTSSTEMQKDTSIVSQYSDIGKSIIKAGADNNNNTIQNFKTG